MAGFVLPGLLFRWFEELCRIKHKALSEIVVSTQNKMSSRTGFSKGGVYAFWWTGDKYLLSGSECNRWIDLSGPKKVPVRLHLNDEWLGIGTGLPIPLYVGKSARSISRRIGRHLMLSNDGRITRRRTSSRKIKPPNSTCQLRAGVEHLFPNEPRIRSLILDNVGLSYVLLDGPEDAGNRFYLEDLAIGLMRPPLNVDVER